MIDTYPHETEIPNAATAAAIQEARQGELPAFDSVAELMAKLNSED
ncbi:MAG: hypothetical protein ABSE44_17875 [Candidatus Sulfotelmatobacter sp.]|jgi:hypothetical protein